MTIYYQDDHVTLYHGDAFDVLPALDVVADVGTTRDRLLTTSDGRQYVSRSYGPWEAAGVQPMDGQGPLL